MQSLIRVGSSAVKRGVVQVRAARAPSAVAFAGATRTPLEGPLDCRVCGQASMISQWVNPLPAGCGISRQLLHELLHKRLMWVALLNSQPRCIWLLLCWAQAGVRGAFGASACVARVDSPHIAHSQDEPLGCLILPHGSIALECMHIMCSTCSRATCICASQLQAGAQDNERRR